MRRKSCWCATRRQQRTSHVLRLRLLRRVQRCTIAMMPRSEIRWQPSSSSTSSSTPLMSLPNSSRCCVRHPDSIESASCASPSSETCPGEEAEEDAAVSEAVDTGWILGGGGGARKQQKSRDAP